MTHFLQSFLLEALKLTTITGVVIFFLRKYLSGRLDAYFSAREKKLESRIKLAEQYEQKMLDAYREMQETIYRSRNIVRDLCVRGDADKIRSLNDLYEGLSENLYKYQLLMPEDIYQLIHKFKGIMQNIVLTIMNSGGEVSPIQEKSIKAAYPEVDAIYHHVLVELRKIFQDKLIVLD